VWPYPPAHKPVTLDISRAVVAFSAESTDIGNTRPDMFSTSVACGSGIIKWVQKLISEADSLKGNWKREWQVAARVG